MKFRRIGSVLLGAIALAATPALAEPETSPRLVQADAAASGTTLAIVTLGTEPRAPLRYNLAAIEPETIVLEIEMAIAATTPGAAPQVYALPALRLRLRAAEMTLQPDGNLRVALTVEDREVLPTPGVAPELHETIEPAFAAIDSFSGALVLDERGRILASDYDHDKDASRARAAIGEPRAADRSDDSSIS